MRGPFVVTSLFERGMEVWPNLWYMPILLLTSDRCLLSASSSPILGRRISLASLSRHWWYSSMLSLVVLLVNLSQVFLSFSWPRVQGYFSVFLLFCEGIVISMYFYPHFTHS